MSSKEEEVLASGKSVMRQVVSGDGKSGRALAVQDVSATPEAVWERVLAFRDYPSMVFGVKETSVYDEMKHRDGTRTLKVRMKLGMMGVTLEYFIDHTYNPKQSVMTWTLDYSRLSDLVDSVGYWCVVSHPTVPGASRVYYSVEAAFPSWVPGFVVNALTSRALTDATGWVKVESEKRSGNLSSRAATAAAKQPSKVCRWKGLRRICKVPPSTMPEALPVTPMVKTTLDTVAWAVAAITVLLYSGVFS